MKSNGQGSIVAEAAKSLSIVAVIGAIGAMLYGGGYYRPWRHSSKSKTVAFVLCLFLGIFGAHRYYLRRYWTAIFYTLTLGCFGIGVVIDLFRLAVGDFIAVDRRGDKSVKAWVSKKTSML